MCHAMKIPFIKIPKPNMSTFNTIFQDSIDNNHYSNFGPNERKLTELLESKVGCSVVLAANASLILDGLHHILSDLCSMAYIPGFTFPSTNLGCRIKFHFGETYTHGNLIGFSQYNPRGGATDYAITTVPFGTTKPKEYGRPDTTFWIVDNAAGASPDMEKIREWLDAGADAVVCSLHATKILNGCEGGFVALNNRFLYEFYKKYIVFGFYLDEHGNKQSEKYGSNHKMSELTASFVMMYYQDIFVKDYEGRMSLMTTYRDFCLKNDMRFIASPQSFWVSCNTDAAYVQKKFLARDIQTTPYYRPLWNENRVDVGSLMLSRSGLCLPTWNMSLEERNYVVDNLGILL